MISTVKEIVSQLEHQKKLLTIAIKYTEGGDPILEGMLNQTGWLLDMIEVQDEG